MTTGLTRFTQKVRAEPQLRLTALMGLVFEPEGLHERFERQDGRKAPGVDGMHKADYAEGLEERIGDLSARVRRLGYRPQNGCYPNHVSSTTCLPCRCGGLRLGAGWCNSPRPVLRGVGSASRYG